MNSNYIIAREGWSFIFIFLMLTILVDLKFDYAWAILPMVLTIFCVFFFRNPERKFEASRGIIVAPADGRVMSIERVLEDNYLHSEAIQIRIFLNLFNVHINRVPINGEVEWIKKTGGINLPAYKKEASNKNVRNYLGLSSEWGKVLVVQLTGLIARRIVCWAKPGDSLNTGERFGLIRFGSCTELYLPPETEIFIQPGQKLRGGETIIGRFCD